MISIAFDRLCVVVVRLGMCLKDDVAHPLHVPFSGRQFGWILFKDAAWSKVDLCKLFIYSSLGTPSPSGPFCGRPLGYTCYPEGQWCILNKAVPCFLTESRHPTSPRAPLWKNEIPSVLYLRKKKIASLLTWQRMETTFCHRAILLVSISMPRYQGNY